jgi:Carboxypeptidase regulatory-like domain
MQALANTIRQNQYAKRSLTQCWWLVAVLMVASFASLHAQQTTGTIVGTVKDQTGALISTAKVKATNVNTGYSRLSPTNGNGQYRIDYLPVGSYIVAVEAPSFQGFVQENLTLSVDQTLTLDIAMTVGIQSQTITVTSAPPSVNTSDAVLGRTISTEEIIGLPLVNRNVYAELSLTPGVMSNSNSPTSNPSGTPNMTVGLPSAAVQVNGSLDSGNGTVAFYLDGGNNITGMRNYGNPAPNPAALEEFRVETNAFSAEYGQFSGAVVTVVTKSGSNKFHGELFEFDRNTAFNAFSWIPTKNPVTKAPMKLPYHRNNFGGAFGGPINHDKAFFFFSYAGLRQTQGAPVTGAFTPTAAERMGDFTADSFTVYTPGTYVPATKTTPATGVPLNGANAGPGCQSAMIGPSTLGKCIPSTLLDPTAANFLNVNNKIGVSVPLPTGAAAPSSGGAQYIGEYTTPTNSDEYLGKYDENIGNADHVTATYFFVKTKSTPSGAGNINWTGNQSAAAQTNVTLADVHTFSANVANQTWLTFTRAMGGRSLIPVTGPANQTLGSFQTTNTTNPFVIDGPAGLPYLNLGSGAFQTGNPNAGPVTGSDNYELRDIVNLTKGKHSLAIGGEFALDKTMFLANLNNYGDVNFATSAPTSTGNVFSDFVTGQTSSFEQDSHYVTHLSTWHIAAFAQDNYRITSRFTANLGLRWDIDTPPNDAHNRTASFIPGQQSTVTPAAPLGQVFVGDSGVGRGIISTSFTHISPRVGFAWDPFGSGKTSVRAAAGIFYGIPSGNEWNQPGNAMPFSIRNNFGNTPSLTNLYGGPTYNFPTTASGGGIFPYTYSPSAPKFYPSQSIEAINPNVKYSSVYQFNLSVQRQLPYNVTMSAAYVGTLGRHLQTFVDANYAPYATVDYLKNPLTPSTAGSNTDLRRQYDAGPAGTAGTLTGITELISDQTSNYNGLQISATKQMSRGFSVSGFYVWSRALESSNPVENGLMSAQDFGVLGKPFTAFNNKYGAIGGGLQEEYGLMDQNRNSNAAISGMWTINYFHGSNQIVKEVVNGWTISPVVYLMSGTPFTVNTGSNMNFDSQGSSRPNVNPGGPSPKLDPHRCRVCGATGQSQQSVVTQWFNGTNYLTNPTGASYMANGPGVVGGIGPGGADGNVGRDTLVGPGLKDMDAALLRNITFERGVEFQFRAEVTNVMNWVSLNNPSSGNISSASQGTITSAAGTQRVIQLGGRLTF